MLTFKEYLGNPSIGIGPAADIYKPMASLNSPHQFPPTTNRKYTTTFSSYLCKGHGTIKPMLTAKKIQASSKIKNEISDKLKSKVLKRKIDRAKVKFYSNLKRVAPKD